MGYIKYDLSLIYFVYVTSWITLIFKACFEPCSINATNWTVSGAC